jgi:hypothetical protein
VSAYQHFILEILEHSAKKVDSKVFKYAKRGIEALINSIQAFHGLRESGAR